MAENETTNETTIQRLLLVLAEQKRETRLELEKLHRRIDQLESADGDLAKHTYRELGDYGVMLDKLKSDIEPLLRNVPIVASRLSALESQTFVPADRKCIVLSCDDPARPNHVLCERHSS